MGRKYRNGINVMHSTRLEALSLMNNHKRQCGSDLFAIGTRHAVMSASVCRNYEHRYRHRGTSWLRLPNDSPALTSLARRGR
jgi:hypothetical protein